MKKVAHLTCVHPRYDTRIFLKQCISLTNKYNVCLVVADGLGDAKESGIDIYDVGRSKGRLSRMALTTRKVYRKAVELKADIYQAHDPELLPVLYKLKKHGYKVIFDSHEDVPKMILSRIYIPKFLRSFISFAYKSYERSRLGRFDGVIGVNDNMVSRFQSLNINSIKLCNYAKMDEFPSIINEPPTNEKYVCFVGSMSHERGLPVIAEATTLLKKINCRIKLAGGFSSTPLRDLILGPKYSKN